MRYFLIALALMATTAQAQTNVGPFIVGWPSNGQNASTSSSALILDAAADRVAFIFTIPKTGTIEQVGIRFGAVTAADEVAVTLETVGTDGLPTGTLYGSMTEGVITTPTANTSMEADIGDATATAGDLVAVVVQFDSFATGNLVILSMLQGSNNALHPRTLWNSGASYAEQTNRLPMVMLKYASADYKIPIGCVPPSYITTVSIQSDTTPDEVGFQYTAPMAMRLVGMTANLDEDNATEELNFHVWDDSATPAQLTTATVFASDALGGSGTGTFCSIGLEPESLAASDVVTVSVFSEDADSNLSIVLLNVDNAAHWGDFMRGITYASRTRNNDATPTNAFTATATAKPIGGLWFDQITAGSGGMAIDPIITK